jgi:hypothetical protein
MDEFDELDNAPDEQWVYHGDYGWLVLDKDPRTELSVFIRCSDWSYLERPQPGWGIPAYTPYRLRISWILDPAVRREEEATLLRLRQEYLARRDDLRSARASRIAEAERRKESQRMEAESRRAARIASEEAQRKRLAEEKRLAEGREAAIQCQERNRLRPFMQLLRDCVRDHGYLASWDVGKVGIDDRDRQLAVLWMGHNHDIAKADAIEAKMLSARRAEKVATLYYQSLGQKVDDISVQ